MKKIKVSEINRGSFVCAHCGMALNGNAIIHTHAKAITCEDCADKVDSRLLAAKFDCRIEAHLNEHAATAVPESVMFCRRNNLKRTFDKLNILVTPARAIRYAATVQLNTMEQLIALHKI